MTIAILLYGWRAPAILPSDSEKVWGYSKESALVVTQFLLATFALLIFIGTIYPIVSEAITGVRFNVQAPYFNKFAPFLGFAFILAITIGNLMRYKSAKLNGGPLLLVLAALVALIPSLLFCLQGQVFASHGYPLAFQLVGIELCFWAMLCLTNDLFTRLRDLKFQFSLFFGRNLAYFGAYIAHLGLLIAILGFLGNYRGIDTTVTLKSGESAELYGYTFTFNGVIIENEHNMKLYAAPLLIEKDNQTIGELKPARAKYPTSEELIHEVGLFGGFWHDLYAILADFDKNTGQRATLQIHINPTVRVVWLSAFFMVLGGIIALFDRQRGVRSKDYFAHH
jgi:cytochrome c-type biogenesis protein CcmF